jgi:hypothetical protein
LTRTSATASLLPRVDPAVEDEVTVDLADPQDAAPGIV